MVYQGANRYYLNNFFMQQHKLEIKEKTFLKRYTTSENGGIHMTCFYRLILIELGR
jgi:hypothetical protein